MDATLADLQVEAQEKKKPEAPKKQKYRKDKPWDNEDIDHWKLDEWKSERGPGAVRSPEFVSKGQDRVASSPGTRRGPSSRRAASRRCSRATGRRTCARRGRS